MTTAPLTARADKGPKVWLDYDQAGLDTAYDQAVWSPLMADIRARLAATSEAVRGRLGAPKRLSYGTTPIEALDVFPAKVANAPIFVHVHGGGWMRGAAKDFAFAAEMFVDAGVNFVVLDFAQIDAFGGDLAPMVAQVRGAVAWVYRNAKQFGGDASRLYVGGHSSGGHLAAMALTCDWEREFGIPSSVIKGGLLISGIYDLKPARMTKAFDYVKFTDASEEALSPQRHVARLKAPLVVTVGSKDSPEFIRQARDFVAAVKAAGGTATLVEAPGFNHFEMSESLGHPYGPAGRAALTLMGLK
ncbi:MAG: alpha/beta hydrolase [Pseudolabrys sp.]